MKTTRGGSVEKGEGWTARRTALPSVAHGITDAPSAGLDAWARTTAGVVLLLFALQFVTGALLAFYYVPSADAAHMTVAYVERVVPAGSWVRALHFHGSQWLPLALLAHLLQLFRRGAHARRTVGWLASILLLALVMSTAATGYSLPWDARAIYSTRIAAGIAGGLPAVGGTARAWLLGGQDVTTLTVSRFYALHILVVPFLILSVAVARLFIFRDRSASFQTPGAESDPARGAWLRAQLARNALTAALVFAALAFVALKFPAPLGPPAGEAAPGYVPRPGAQFLWLFQLLKYFSPAVASLVALLLPGLLLGALALLPFTGGGRAEPNSRGARRTFGLALFATCFLLVATLSALAYLEDARDPRVREQLARQAHEEAEFRSAPFSPRRVVGAGVPGEAENSNADAPVKTVQPQSQSENPPPSAYAQNCAKCHGANGEGRSVNPPLVGVASRPNRAVEDIVAIINNPRAYNLEKRMPSFKDKLTEEEKHAIAEWVVSLKR